MFYLDYLRAILVFQKLKEKQKAKILQKKIAYFIIISFKLDKWCKHILILQSKNQLKLVSKN